MPVQTVDYPNTASHEYDFSSIELDIEGVGVVVGIKEVSVSAGRDIGKIFGTAGQKIGRTRGQLDPEGSITFYSREYLLRFVASLGDGYMEATWNATLSLSTPNSPTVTLRLIGCTITSDEFSGSEGADALEESIDLDIMRVEVNGFNQLANMLT